eukprot:SM000039S14449  [mRNA]  locus=s39:267586:271425:+ [translate_table: standard]
MAPPPPSAKAAAAAAAAAARSTPLAVLVALLLSGACLGAVAGPVLRTVAVHDFPYRSVGPYDWAYFPVDVPVGAAVLQVVLIAQWPHGEGSATVCFRKGGPPLASLTAEESLLDAAILAAKHNSSSPGTCAPFTKSTSIEVNSAHDLPGVWHLGVFSVANSSRTQSQMIERGNVYKFGLRITVTKCALGTLVGGTLCQHHITPLPLTAPTVTPPSVQTDIQSESHGKVEVSTGQQLIGPFSRSVLELPADSGSSKSQTERQCLAPGQWKYYALSIDEPAAKLQVQLTEGNGGRQEWPFKVFLKHNVLPTNATGESLSVVDVPASGTWYVGVVRAEDSTASEEQCFSMSWTVHVCEAGTAGEECVWGLTALEKVAPRYTYESQFDSTYMPPGMDPPDWPGRLFRILYSQTPRLSKHESVAAMQAVNQQPMEPVLNSRSSQLICSGQTAEVWAYFSADIPLGSSGTVLTFDLRLIQTAEAALGLGPLAEEEETVPCMEIYARHGAPPTRLMYDMKMAPDAAYNQTYESLSPGNRATRLITQYRLDITYPAPGKWYVGVRVAYPLGKEVAPIYQQEMMVTLHGCPRHCSNHGTCHSMFDASSALIFYCYCDRTHGDYDCSQELLSPDGENWHLWALVLSNAAATLPALWALRHKASRVNLDTFA